MNKAELKTGQGLSCADLLAVLGGAQAANLTAEKTHSIATRSAIGGGYQITGFVLCNDRGDRCIVEKSAVRWINKDEMWWLMQVSESPIHSANTDRTEG